MDEIRNRRIYWHKNKLILDRSRSHPSMLARSLATTERVGARTDKSHGHVGTCRLQVRTDSSLISDFYQ